MVYGKTVCKGLFSDGFYICSMHFDWSAVSEAGFHGYEYCNHIHSGGFDYFHCDRWLSLQCGRLFFKCLFILLFSDRTKDVFQTYAVGYPVTFFIMLISSVLTGALAAKLKTHAKLSAQLAFRTQILFDTDRLLQKAKGENRDS